jgi:hypothetical protein
MQALPDKNLSAADFTYQKARCIRQYDVLKKFDKHFRKGF